MTDERPPSPEPEGQPPVTPDPEEPDPKLQELETLAEELRVDVRADEIHAEFEEKLAKFDARFQAEKTAHEARKVEQEQRMKSDRESTKGLGLGMTLAYAIVGVPVFGYFAGFAVDKSLGTNTWAGIGMLIGALIGIAAAVVMLSRQTK